MRQQGLVIAALILLVPVLPAMAAPLAPAQDKPGALMAYQTMGEDDRRATLQAFSGQSMASDSLYESMDACTMRQTTEEGASHWRLSRAVAACTEELGLPAPHAASASR